MDKIKKILVVDDEKDILDLMTRMLSKDGYDILTAESGHQAEVVLKDHQEIGLVLSDIKMPDGNGIELLDGIKKEDPKKPFVVIFTGFYDFSIEDLFDKGACAVVMKPFDWKTIKDILTEQLRPFPKFKKPHMEYANMALAIETSFKSLKEAVKDNKGFKIGRGGLFLRTNKELKEKDLVRFKFTFNEGEPKTFEGIAEVAWQRLEDSKELPAGIGAKFINLTEETETFVMNYTNDNNIISYIPKA